MEGSQNQKVGRGRREIKAGEEREEDEENMEKKKEAKRGEV